MLSCTPMLMTTRTALTYVSSALYRTVRTSRSPYGSQCKYHTQVRWSIIKKETNAIYWALLKLDDLVGGDHYTTRIRSRTDHRKLIFMNNHGSWKVLQWKLGHYNRAGKANISANIFNTSRDFEQIILKRILQIIRCVIISRFGHTS